MAIERVEGWKDSNGVIHDTEEKALEADKEYAFRLNLERWCSNNIPYSDNQRAVYNAILEHRYELMDILNS